jgi:adenylate cyclase
MSSQYERPETLEEWARSQHPILALVFTDIIQSTDIGVKLTDRKWIEDLFIHFSRARTLASYFECHVVKVIGDAFMVAFRNPTDAVDFALELVNDTGVNYIGIRVTINSGQVQIRENDIYGLNVNFTSRMQKEMPNEGILVSNSVKEDYEKISGGIPFVPRQVNLESFGIKTLWQISSRPLQASIANQRNARQQLPGTARSVRSRP